MARTRADPRAEPSSRLHEAAPTTALSAVLSVAAPSLKLLLTSSDLVSFQVLAKLATATSDPAANKGAV